MQCMFCVGISFNKTKRKAKRCDDGFILNASNDPRVQSESVIGCSYGQALPGIESFN